MTTQPDCPACAVLAVAIRGLLDADAAHATSPTHGNAMSLMAARLRLGEAYVEVFQSPAPPPPPVMAPEPTEKRGATLLDVMHKQRNDARRERDIARAAVVEMERDLHVHRAESMILMDVIDEIPKDVLDTIPTAKLLRAHQAMGDAEKHLFYLSAMDRKTEDRNTLLAAACALLDSAHDVPEEQLAGLRAAVRGRKVTPECPRCGARPPVYDPPYCAACLTDDHSGGAEG